MTYLAITETVPPKGHGPDPLTMENELGKGVGQIAPGDHIHAEIGTTLVGWYVHVYDFGTPGHPKQLSGYRPVHKPVSVTSAEVVHEWPNEWSTVGLASSVTFTNTYLGWGGMGAGQDFVTDIPGFGLIETPSSARER